MVGRSLKNLYQVELLDLRKFAEVLASRITWKTMTAIRAISEKEAPSEL